MVDSPVMVANIKALLRGDWAGRRSKDPGRINKRHVAEGKREKRRERAERRVERETDWLGNDVVAAASLRSGKKSGPVGDKAAAGKERKAAAGKEKKSGGGKGKTVKKGKQKRGEIPTGGRGGESSGTPGEGQPLCMRGFDPGAEDDVPRVEEVEEEEPPRVEELTAEEEEGWSDTNGCDLEENLTYYEDSLSVLRGRVTTPLGRDLLVWVTTDSGSMTRLVQEDYARVMKFPRKRIPEDKTFNISSPGGGRDEIVEYVELHVTVLCKKERVAEQAYEDCESEEEERTIKMMFGVCANLPVPILWGGHEMRSHEILDYHRARTLSVRLGGRTGDRYITKSTSWLTATMEMRAETEGKVRKACKGFLPSEERFTNMVMGGRETYNLAAVLYPGRDNLVRVGRHNARVDEGYNEVLVSNLEEFRGKYGDWVVPIECITNGEAYVIIRNNADRPVRLTPGDLRVTVRPSVTLPHILAPSEVARYTDGCQRGGSSGDLEDDPAPDLLSDSESEAGGDEEYGPPPFTVADDSDSEDEGVGEWRDEGAPSHEVTRPLGWPRKDRLATREDQEERELEIQLAGTTWTDRRTSIQSPQDLPSPKRFFTWNCNGLKLRVTRGDLAERFYAQLGAKRPDIISLQEVRLECEPGQPGVVRVGSKCEEAWKAFMAPLKDHFTPYLSLSPDKYGGQAVLVRKTVEEPRVSYHMGDTPGHYKSGRFMRLEFSDLVVRSVYVPFNGAGKEGHYLRRQDWDEELRKELLNEERDLGKARILLGDLNVVLSDGDISGSPDFWKKQGDQGVAEGNRGFGGTTTNERLRATEGLLVDGGLSDTFTKPLNPDEVAEFTFRGQGRFFGKGMKLDYILADDALHLSGGVESSEILSEVYSRAGFMGSDHAPLMCVLDDRWQKKRANLLAHYGAAEPGDVKSLLSSMFKETAAAQTLPKIVSAVAREESERRSEAREEYAGLSTTRPELFPEEFWDYVEPAQRPLVEERFSRYQDKEYLAQCMTDFAEKLDVQPREEFYAPPWLKDRGGEPALQEKFFRAQAMANPHIYFFPNPEEVSMAKDVLAEVVTTNEKPFKCRPRKYSVHQQAFLKAKTNIMLRMQQLEDANSEWCHGLVLVAYDERIQAFMKKHGDLAMEKMFETEHEAEVATFFRLCVDLRMLNARTVPDRFPLPRIDDLLESVPRSCGRYSISGIADAFFKCELAKGDRHKTAFRTHDRHLQFAVLPQGFINSLSVFCRLIAKTFSGMPRDKFSAYIDDVLNHSDDIAVHLGTQQQLYDRLGSARLTLKLSKTHLNYERVKFLGHILTREGRLPDPEAVEAIREWADPTTTKEVRSFLGSTLYYREYIYGYSDMAMPLYDLIKKGVVVQTAWKQEVHGKACQQIKDALTSKPVLMQVDNTKPFRLKVDACRVGRGIGSILEQQNSEGKWQPVSYYSCSLSKEERNYSATELECKALHDCILHYAVYLKHVPHFEVFSDHNALRYMVNSDNATTNGRLMRYLLDLQEYNFAIYYRKGTDNCDADAVSRLKRTSDKPVYWTEDELSRENGVVSKSMLERARALDRRNAILEKSAKKILNRLAKEDLREMSILNDHILSEGVENLESESGRARFFENLKAQGLKCTRETLDTRLRTMKEDMGGPSVGESSDTMLANMVDLLGENRGLGREAEEEGQPLCMRGSESEDDDLGGDESGQEGTWRSVLCGECTVERDHHLGGTNPENNGFDSGAAGVYSREEVPLRLAMLVHEMEPSWGDSDVGVLEQGDWDPECTSTEHGGLERLTSRRDEMGRRVERLANLHVLAAKRSTRKRKPKAVSYSEEEGMKIQPNWKHFNGKLLSSPANEKLKADRKFGHVRMVVKESLIPGDTGWGLFTEKDIPAGMTFCSYEGPIVPEAHLREGYGNKDYVVEAIKDHKTGELICMDSPVEASCYGRYAQDPIDEDLVNAKILWRKGKLVLVATVPIQPGDEIYVHYGLDYWAERLEYLDEASRARIEPRILKRRGLGQSKGVQFRGEVTVAEFDKNDTPEDLRGGVLAEGELLRPAAVDFRVRMEELEIVEGEEDQRLRDLELDQELLDELAFESVDECEELAEKLQFLNGRKFEDEGRTYEIMQVRYDPEFEQVIGFRRPMSGKTPHREDGSSFAVYGKEGLYELSERYLLTHPEARNDAVWPRDNVEWAAVQAGDPELADLIREIEAAGGSAVKRGRNKYALKSTDLGQQGLLVRLVTDLRKGDLVQVMVPRSLVKSTLQMHHEGYGHMGTNRMLETVRLRYFWSKMDQDIIKHCGDCLNCKLRKTYQRKPKVPIMKYDDTSRPLDRVHVDLTGPLPLTKAKHRYIMVVKDYLTKYVWLIPLKTKSAQEVAEAFVGEFICQCGVPGRVVSDRGNEFVNQLLTNVSKVMGINRISTTPYNPRADGFVENHNKTLKDQLFHFVDTLKQDDWDVYLPTVQLMYNTTVSLATGYTPMLLLNGRESRMPSMNHLASEDEALRKDVVNNAYVLKMIESMRGYQDFALSQTDKNKERFNVRVRQPLEFVEYEVGQQFMRVRRPLSKFKSADEEKAWKISSKLLERYEGPYRITARINPVLYEAEIDGKVVRVHAVNMKPF
jgi:exodeoxyribonuclease III